jgi:hypothetical protein
LGFRGRRPARKGGWGWVGDSGRRGGGAAPACAARRGGKGDSEPDSVERGHVSPHQRLSLNVGVLAGGRGR